VSAVRLLTQSFKFVYYQNWRSSSGPDCVAACAG
jgi:hypothetical protein